jgi:hypothetical protein
MTEITNDYEFVRINIDSSNNEYQLQCCAMLIELFGKKHHDEGVSKLLSDRLKWKADVVKPPIPQRAMSFS